MNTIEEHTIGFSRGSIELPRGARVLGVFPDLDVVPILVVIVDTLVEARVARKVRAFHEGDPVEHDVLNGYDFLGRVCGCSYFLEREDLAMKA